MQHGGHMLAEDFFQLSGRCLRKSFVLSVEMRRNRLLFHGFYVSASK